MAAPPETRERPCASPGNPVFSCVLDAAARGPGACPREPRLLLYRTTAADYGALPPTAATAPCRHFPRDSALTDHLLVCGRNPASRLNTALDKGPLCP
ncbi:piercer of microtubule wall 2 protein [Eublepharis macularius]|uniref:Piercer of microtubule wall 2 protein n=1 Tax=Eublepharis macularius TaxID=481883 RepID=A0AA97KH15_EUBMA|nr:piercer of microtubule wall 2 protein [Eublepharis macularius]